MDIEQVLSDISRALRIPVLVLAVVALAAVIAAALRLPGHRALRRRRRDLDRLEDQLAAAQEALDAGDVSAAQTAVRSVAVTQDMADVLAEVVRQRSLAQSDERIAKRLANYDYRQLRRLERTRVLVRFGPGLGLMGTLIPLTPALSGLAKGNLDQLTSNLQVAFSVTVVGLLVGATAFMISLIRDRLYGHDYSDVEYIAATLHPNARVDGPGVAAGSSVAPGSSVVSGSSVAAGSSAETERTS